MAFTPSIPMQTVDGYLIPKLGFFEKIVRSALRFKPDPDDIILATYPKCGTTWAQYIIWEILNHGAPPPSPNEMIFKFCPFLEMTGPEAVQQLTGRPRVIKVHTPYGLTPRNDATKYIFVSRNPFDVCVSLYYHLREIDFRIAELDIDFDEYFEHFIRGLVPFGDYFEHTTSWYQHKDDKNVLFCSYENIKFDHGGAVLRIAEFMNHDYRTTLERDNGQLRKIVFHSSFEYMKENLKFRVARTDDALKEDYGKNMKAPTDDDMFQTVNFFREGKVGSWKDIMSEDQRMRLEKRMEEKITDHELLNLLKF